MWCALLTSSKLIYLLSLDWPSNLFPSRVCTHTGLPHSYSSFRFGFLWYNISKGILASGKAHVVVLFFNHTVWVIASPQRFFGSLLKCSRARVCSKSVQLSCLDTPLYLGVSCMVSVGHGFHNLCGLVGMGLTGVGVGCKIFALEKPTPIHVGLWVCRWVWVWHSQWLLLINIVYYWGQSILNWESRSRKYETEISCLGSMV